MNSRSVVVALTVITVALAGVRPAFGQTDTSPAGQWTVPRTPDGQPDLQGVLGKQQHHSLGAADSAQRQSVSD